MKVIQQIEIKNFRSFGNRKKESYKVVRCNDLNIISGANDSGKSNILRALNLFFNGHTNLNQFFDFQRDFHRKENPDDFDIKEELVTIKIWFINKRNSGKNEGNASKTFLPVSFWVSKKWKKTSTYSSHDTVSSINKEFEKEKGSYFENFLDPETGSLKSTVNASLQKQLTDFLNSIQYHYVPAIKGKDYFSHLFGELQKTLWKAKISDIESKKVEFETSIQNETDNLMNEFKSSVIASSEDSFNPIFELPSDLVNVFKALIVQTGNVDLTLRGDGLQAKLIPEILHFISIKERSISTTNVKTGEKSKRYFIWGFEEPENSYEYKNAQLFADKLKSLFIQNAQIFLTTHSFNFVSLNEDVVSTYRVWKDFNVSNSKISKIKKDAKGRLRFEGNEFKSDWQKLEEELGFFYLNTDLQQLYRKQEENLRYIKEKIESIDKPIVYSEGHNVKYLERALEAFAPELSLEIKDGGGKTELKKFFLKLSRTSYNRHKMFFAFDCDAIGEYKACEDEKTSNLLPFIFKRNEENNIPEIFNGIENLFSSELFDNESRFFTIDEHIRDGNIQSRKRKLRKDTFLEYIIEERNQDDDFIKFKPFIEFLEENM